MRSRTNKQRLTNLIKGIQRSIDLFPSQGYSDVFFTAQFLRGGKKQNGIERGDISAFANQVRTYVDSEEADTVRIEFIDDSTGKSVYSKLLTELQVSDSNSNNRQPEERQSRPGGYDGLTGFGGLGEVQIKSLVEKQVSEARMADHYQRMSEELDSLRKHTARLEEEKEELEATLKAKKDTEYYMGIIGAAFPGLATLFTGTPLAQAAGFLAGTADMQGNPVAPVKGEAEGEARSVASLIAEFCDTLSNQELSSVHLLFIAFEKDKNLIGHALHFITTQTEIPNGNIQ